MKKLLLAAGVAMATFAMAAPANAGDIDISGEVAVQCYVNPSDHAIDLGALSGTGGGFSGSHVFNVYCNQKFSGSAELQNGRLLNVDASPAQINPEGNNNYGAGPFLAALDYTIEAVGYGAPVSTAGIPGGVSFSVMNQNPINAAVTLVFTTVAGTGQLTAGSYQDTITFSITPTGL